jgi:hypothetical protein
VVSIIEFLEARIGEDEALAIAVIAKYDPDDWENSTATGNFWPEEVAFWDSATPYRTLAECEVKRSIVAMHGPVKDEGWVSWAPRRADGHLWCGMCGSVDDSPEPYPCGTLKALSALYKDHPDYQQEWARG